VLFLLSSLNRAMTFGLEIIGSLLNKDRVEFTDHLYRGNKYSKKSIHHGPNSSKFWDFR